MALYQYTPPPPPADDRIRVAMCRISGLEWLLGTVLVWNYMSKSVYGSSDREAVMATLGSNYNTFVLLSPALAILFLYLGFGPAKVSADSTQCAAPAVPAPSVRGPSIFLRLIDMIGLTELW